MTKLWTGHEIYPVTDYVNLWPQSVTLILEVGDRLLRMTHLLIIVSNCGKYLQNPFKDKNVVDRTRHIPSNRQCWPWMSKCNLDLGGVWLLRMTHRLIITNICAKLFQIPLINDKVMDRTRKCDGRRDGWTDGRTDGRTDGWTDERSLFLYPPFFFEKAGDKKPVKLTA
jgi:hypothetical protein